MGLLYYNSENNELSKAKFRQSLESNTNQGNQRFQSYCHLFLGNVNFKERKYEDAINEYKRGISADSLNAYLHFNLAAALLFNADSNASFEEYQIASSINSNLVNPLREMDDTLPKQQSNSSKVIVKKQYVNTQVKKTDTVNTVFVPQKQNSTIASSDYSIVDKDNLFGVLNSKGDTLIKCIYESLDTFSYKGKTFFIIKSNAKYGAINQSGGMEIPIKHPSLDYVKRVIKILSDTDPNSNIGL
jgi:tetratricopeptide (TPR) repeat protein